MPVLRFKPGRVEEALGLSLDKALEAMERLKIEVELDESGYVVAELEVDRPDMYALEGIARQVRGLLERELGLPQYSIVDTGYVIEADNVPTRPYIVGLIVWDVDVDEDYLVELIQFQEKLTISHGLGRRRIAIGIHDLDKMPSSKLRYSFEHIDRIRFKPLHSEKIMTLRDVIQGLEQGLKYGSISLKNDMHPVLYSGNEVISVPPVINADITRVEPGTKHVFVDITGTELKPVLDAASIFAANLAERSRRKSIGLVQVNAPWGKLKEPRMEPRMLVLDTALVRKVLGLSLSGSDIAYHLRRMRFGANSLDEDRVEVTIPRYRVDILHGVDLAEEVLLSIGLDKVGSIRPERMLRGLLFPIRYWEREARSILVGYGFIEVKTYSLVSCREQESIAGVGRDSLVVLQNPVGVESDCLRASLIPGLLKLASRNQHFVPLRIFELGETIRRISGEESSRREAPIEVRKTLATLIMGDKIGYEDIQSIVYGLVELLSDRIREVRRVEKPFLIKGRSAIAVTEKGLSIILGEVEPRILESLEIRYPVAVAEIDFTKLYESSVEYRGGAAVPRP